MWRSEEEKNLLFHNMSSLGLPWKHLAGHKQGECFTETSLNFCVTSLSFARGKNRMVVWKDLRIHHLALCSVVSILNTLVCAILKMRFGWE